MHTHAPYYHPLRLRKDRSPSKPWARGPRGFAQFSPVSAPRYIARYVSRSTGTCAFKIRAESKCAFTFSMRQIAQKVDFQPDWLATQNSEPSSQPADPRDGARDGLDAPAHCSVPGSARIFNAHVAFLQQRHVQMRRLQLHHPPATPRRLLNIGRRALFNHDCKTWLQLVSSSRVIHWFSSLPHPAHW